MKATFAAAKNVDSYISAQPDHVQELLKRLRQIIRSSAPDAEELISYRMPAYSLHGMLVYFAGYKNHIGFYPGAGGVEAFKKELTNYKLSKGTIQFPLDKKLPVALISKIVKFRVKQNLEKAKAKAR